MKMKPLAGNDDIPDVNLLKQLNPSILTGDGVLRAALRDRDHRWSHVMVGTMTDAIPYTYDHGRSFSNAGNDWDEKSLLNSSVGSYFWEIRMERQELLSYIHRFIKTISKAIFATTDARQLHRLQNATLQLFCRRINLLWFLLLVLFQIFLLLTFFSF